MRWTVILALVLISQDPANKVNSLVEQLKSDEIATRESASAELVKLGSAAIPGIRSHFAKATEELRAVLKSIVRRIERDERVARLSGPGPRVTLSAKDKPADDVLAEITKQTGVAIGGRSLPDGTRLTLEAKDLPLAAALDAICATHGGLRSNWSPSDVTLVTGAPRTLPSFDTGPFRFAPDRIEFKINEANKPPSTSASLRGGLVGPRECFPDAAWIEVQYAVDDRGNNLGSTNGPGAVLFRSNNSFSNPLVPEGERIFQGLTWFPNPPPSATATKVKKLKGLVRMAFAVDFKVSVSLENPTGAPKSKGSAGDVTFEIQAWSRDGAVLGVDYRVSRTTLGGANWRDGDFERAVPIAIEDRDSRRLAGRCGRERVAHRDDEGGKRWEIDGHTEFTIPDGFEIATMDLLEPVEKVTLSIPFELNDVPLTK